MCKMPYFPAGRKETLPTEAATQLLKAKQGGGVGVPEARPPVVSCLEVEAQQ